MPETELPTRKRITKAQRDAASRVGTRVDIYDVRLIAQEVRLSRWDKLPKMIGVGHGAETRRDSEKKDKIVVEATFTFEMAEEEGAKEDSPVVIRAKYALSYNVAGLETMSDGDVELFGEIHGVYNAWPFWRELVYSTMSRMGLPPITLPTFRVVDEDEVATE